MPASDYTPDLTQVGAIVRTRTKTAAGREAGTFNPDSQVDTATETRPTAEQATELINLAVDKMEGLIGPDVPDGPDPDDPGSLRKMAKRVTSILAGMFIELTFFPEQVNSGRSSYPQLKELFDSELAELINAIQAVGGTPVDPGASADDHALPSFYFPPVDQLVGWYTPF
jgi:hypothetical protein